MPDLFDRFRVIDTDTHVTEPADLWTSRVPSKWRDRVPHVERIGKKDFWILEGKPCGMPGIFSMAGFDGTVPEFPDTYDDIPVSSYDAMARPADVVAAYARYLEIDPASTRANQVRAQMDALQHADEGGRGPAENQ